MSAEEVGEDATVNFTVKELLSEQTGLLREIKSAVDGKADKADLVPIIARLEAHGGRIQTIEDERKGEKATKEAHRSTRKTVSWAVAAILVPFGSAMILVFVH